MTEPRDDKRPAVGQDDGDLDLTAPPPVGPPAGIHEDIDDAPVAEPRPPRTLKGAAILSARLVTAIIGLAIAVVVLGATIFLPLPTLSAEPPSELVTPVAAEQERVCAGPLLRLGDDTGAQATTASALGRPAITRGATEGDVEESRATDAQGSADAGADILSLPSGDDEEQSALLAASQAQSVSRGEFVGTAAAECLEPRDDTWLVGGATTTGRTTILTIVNPDDVPATVDITVYSDAGAVTAPGTSGIAIPPSEQRVFSLAGLAPGLSSPVVRVESQGALVVATLQQSTVRTLEPGGLDIITPSVAPSTEFSIPGIIFPDPEELEEAIVGEDYLDLNSALRMFVPGEAQAHAVVTMVPVTEEGARSDEEPVDISVTLDPGRVTELPVSEFDPGRYVATITSDVPLVAAVRVANVAGNGENDFVWLPSVETVEESVLIAVARGSNPVLTLHNPTGDDVEAVLVRGTREAPIEVGAGSAVFVEVAEDTVYRLEGFDELRLSVGFAANGTITSHTVSPRAPGSTPIVIYP